MIPFEALPSPPSRETLKNILSYKAENFCRPLARDHRTPDGLPEWVAEAIRKVMRFHSREGNLRVRLLTTKRAWVAAGCPRDLPPWKVIEKRAVPRW